jgi:hypothetical protein
MKFSAIDAITNNLVAARFWMFLAILFAGLAVSSPYFNGPRNAGQGEGRHP